MLTGNELMKVSYGINASISVFNNFVCSSVVFASSFVYKNLMGRQNQGEDGFLFSQMILCSPSLVVAVKRRGTRENKNILPSDGRGVANRSMSFPSISLSSSMFLSAGFCIYGLWPLVPSQPYLHIRSHFSITSETSSIFTNSNILLTVWWSRL